MQKRTKKACYNCKKGHRKCNDERPCSYCVKTNKRCFEAKSVNQLKQAMPTFYNNIYININQQNQNQNPQIKRQMIAYSNYPNNPQMNNINQDGNNGFNRCDYRSEDNNSYFPQDNQYDINGYRIIKNVTDLSEEERLKEEIENLKREINEIDKLNLPDDLLNFDPIELFQLQQSFIEIPPIFLPENGKKAGNMYAFFSYSNEILDIRELHTTKNLRIREISEMMSLAQGYQSTEMVGKSANFFTPLSKEADGQLGREVAELCKTNLTFLRVIGFSKSHDGSTFAFDTDVCIFANNGRMTNCFVVLKQIRMIDDSFPDNNVPRVTLIN